MLLCPPHLELLPGPLVLLPSPACPLAMLTLRSPSFPPAAWMASISTLCRHVSFGTGLWTTGLNFFFGPKMLAGKELSPSPRASGNGRGLSPVSRVLWLWVLDTCGQSGGSGSHAEPLVSTSAGCVGMGRTLSKVCTELGARLALGSLGFF